MDRASHEVVSPLVQALFQVKVDRPRSLELGAKMNQAIAKLWDVRDHARALALVGALADMVTQGQRFLRARAASAPWSRGTRLLDRGQVEHILRGLQEAAKLANQHVQKGDEFQASSIWRRALEILHEGLLDHLLNTRPGQEPPIWSHLPASKAVALRKQIQTALDKMYEAGNIIDGFNYQKLDKAIHDFYRAMHDVLDAQEAHEAPQVAFKGAEREELNIAGTPVILEYQADKKSLADKARHTLEEVLHILHQGAQRAGIKLPAMFVSYASHPSQKYLTLSIHELANGQASSLARKIAMRIGERMYRMAPGGARADWDLLMMGYWRDFTIQDPANNMEIERPHKMEAFGTALAGLLLKGPSYLDPKVLASVLAINRASHL